MEGWLVLLLYVPSQQLWSLRDGMFMEGYVTEYQSCDFLSKIKLMTFVNVNFL